MNAALWCRFGTTCAHHDIPELLQTRLLMRVRLHMVLRSALSNHGVSLPAIGCNAEACADDAPSYCTIVQPW